MPLYLLSNGQRKELMVRGRRLDLALPMPPFNVTDLAEWARSVLPEDVRQYVRGARQRTLYAAPRVGAKHQCLTDVLGVIIHDRPSSDVWVIQVLAVIVELAPQNTRHTPIAAQWPLDVIIDGHRLVADFVG